MTHYTVTVNRGIAQLSDSLPVVLVFFFLYLKSSFPKLHDLLLDENGIVEWLQVVALVSAGLLAIVATSRKLTSVMAGTSLAAFMFLCALEELDWLQQVLNFRTPDFLSKINKQNAVNLHNVSWMHQLSRLVMVVIAIWGLIAPYLARLRYENLRFPLVASKRDQWYLVFVIAFFALRFSIGSSASMVRASDPFIPGFVTWDQQEVVELFLYTVFLRQSLRFQSRTIGVALHKTDLCQQKG